MGSTLIAGGVAVCALHGNPRPYLFSGPLGGPLRELNLPREVFGGERIIAYEGLSAAPPGGPLGGFLGGFAVGTWDGVTNQSVAQVWRTSDGTDWQRLDGVASLTGTSAVILEGRAVAVGARRVVVVGTVLDVKRLSDGDEGAVWWSDDGSSWSRADLSGAHMGGAGNQVLRTVAAVGGRGFLTGGSNGGAAAMWSSVDGRQWRAADPLPGGTGPGATITAAEGGAGASGRLAWWGAPPGSGAPRTVSTGPLGRCRPPSSSGPGPPNRSPCPWPAGRLLVVVRGTRGSYAAVVDGP